MVTIKDLFRLASFIFLTNLNSTLFSNLISRANKYDSIIICHALLPENPCQNCTSLEKQLAKKFTIAFALIFPQSCASTMSLKKILSYFLGNITP